MRAGSVNIEAVVVALAKGRGHNDSCSLIPIRSHSRKGFTDGC